MLHKVIFIIQSASGQITSNFQFREIDAAMVIMVVMVIMVMIIMVVIVVMVIMVSAVLSLMT